MPHHSAPQKKDSSKVSPGSEGLASRPFAAQSQPEVQASEPPTLESPAAHFSILNPDGGRSLPIQPKLTLGASHDKPELEAAIAEPMVQRLYSPEVGRSTSSQQQNLSSTTSTPQAFLHHVSSIQPALQTVEPILLESAPQALQDSLLGHEKGVRLPSHGPTQMATAIQRELVDADAASKISSQDVAYELIAHRLAYNGTTGVEAWLDEQGYEQSWRDTVTGLGLFVGLLMPKEGSSKTPVLAFKGTQPSKLGDVLADIDPVAVGFAAFKANQKEVAALMGQAGGKVDVVGHSLGGALAQQAASAFPGRVRKAVTFQAPGISQEQVRQFNALPEDERPEVTHHIATGDVVDLAGGKHLGGSGIYTGEGNANFFLHHISQQGRMNISSHTQYLLQDDQFANQKQEAGIDGELHEQLGIADKIGKHRKGVEQYDDNPFWFRQFTSERAREFASPGGALAIGGAALAQRGRQNFAAGGLGNKVLGATQMVGGGVGALAGGIGALAGGAVGGAVGLVGGGLGYAGQGAIAGGKALVKGTKAFGRAVGQGAMALGNAVVKGGGAIARGAAALAQSAMSFLPGRQKQGNAAQAPE